MNPIRVLLVDDHPVFRDGLRLMLETDERIKIVGEASTGQEALERVAEIGPDLVLLDINMPDMDGSEVAASLRGGGFPGGIVFVTMEKSSLALRQALEQQINGYLLKNSSAREIIDAVCAVAQGERYFSPAVAELLVSRVQAGRDLEQEVPGLGTLSPTEREVLRQVAMNRMSKEIAGALGISPRTVDRHRNNISRKLQLSGNMPLLNWALLHQAEIVDLLGQD